MKVRFASAVLAASAVVALPAAADAATLKIQPDAKSGCYVLDVTKTHLQFAMGGFQASAPFAIDIDGSALDTGGATTDAQGAFVGEFTPGIPKGIAEKTETMTVSDGIGNTAGGQFLVSRFAVQHSQFNGPVKSVRASYSVFGFGKRKTVYIHYILHRKHRKTVRLGRTKGLCGHLITKSRKVFPFNPKTGTWTLQFDTKKHYSKKTKLRWISKVKVTRTRGYRAAR